MNKCNAGEEVPDGEQIHCTALARSHHVNGTRVHSISKVGGNVQKMVKASGDTSDAVMDLKGIKNNLAGIEERLRREELKQM